MADEEAVVEDGNKKSGGGGIIPLITLVLVVASLGVSVFSLIQVQGAVSAIEDAAVEANKPTPLPGEVPLSEIQTYSLADQFIVIYEDVPNGMKYTVVCSLTVGIHNTESKDDDEEVASVASTLAANETILHSGLTTYLMGKSYDDFKTAEGQKVLKEELTTWLQERIGSNVIFDVYINDYVSSSSKI